MGDRQVLYTVETEGDDRIVSFSLPNASVSIRYKFDMDGVDEASTILENLPYLWDTAMSQEA